MNLIQIDLFNLNFAVGDRLGWRILFWIYLNTCLGWDTCIGSFWRWQYFKVFNLSNTLKFILVILNILKLCLQLHYLLDENKSFIFNFCQDIECFMKSFVLIFIVWHQSLLCKLEIIWITSLYTRGYNTWKYLLRLFLSRYQLELLRWWLFEGEWTFILSNKIIIAESSFVEFQIIWTWSQITWLTTRWPIAVWQLW